MAVRAALGLGSNMGDRLATLQGAVDALQGTPGVRVVALSGIYETDPVGGPDQDEFLNAVAIVDIEVPPRDLLAACQRIEADWDRVRDVRWGPRTLDIDILAVGDETSDDLDLTLPHPRAAERAFVCIPWADADAEAFMPGRGSDRDLPGALDVSGVRRREDLSLVIGSGVG